MTSVTTPVPTIAPMDGGHSAHAGLGLLLAERVGDFLAATIAVLAVSALGGPFTTAHAGPLIIGWALIQALGIRPSPLEGRREHRLHVLHGATVAALMCFLAVALLPLPAAPLAAFVALATAFSLVVRLIPSGAAPTMRTLVLGELVEADAVAERLSQATGGSLTPVAVCTLDQLPEALAGASVDLVLALPGPGLSDRALQRVGWRLEGAGIPLLVGTRLADVATARARVARIGAMNVMHLAPAHRRGVASHLKTAWERGAAATALFLLAPVLIAIAVAVRLDSPGPAIFRQCRVGLEGTPFTMWKFRTMYVDATDRLPALREQCDDMLFKLEDDPRVTRLGRLLRRYSLDELPQLVNVVRGEMALVGPRPALPEEVAAYDEDPRHRLVVKPGLTGLWQVSGRSDLSWDETVRLDLDYVDNWSIGGDLTILLRTVGAVLSHRGAY